MKFGSEVVAISERSEFIKGKILTQEMLNVATQYPLDIFKELFAENGNCVIAGLNVRAENEKIFLCPGIIQYDGILYFLSQEISLTDLWNELHEESGVVDGKEFKQLFLKFVPEESAIIKNNCGVSIKKLILMAESTFAGKGVCVGAFNYNFVPRLPEKGDLSQLGSGSYFDFRYFNYRSIHGLTYHPFVFETFIHYLQKKKSKDVYDNFLLMQLQTVKVIGLGSLIAYIDCKGVYIKNRSNRIDIYNAMVDALKKTMKSQEQCYVNIDNQKKTQSVYKEDDEIREI